MNSDRAALSADEIKSRIRQGLSSLDEFSSVEEIGDDDPLEGILDSVNMMELVAKLEQDYQIRVSENDLGWENFSSINRMAEFLLKKKNTTT